MPDASPAKWHLAHTTWFWETFLLEPYGGAAPFDADFRTLFNSYYVAVGERPARETRGMITPPGPRPREGLPGARGRGHGPAAGRGRAARAGSGPSCGWAWRTRSSTRSSWSPTCCTSWRRTRSAPPTTARRRAPPRPRANSPGPPSTAVPRDWAAATATRASASTTRARSTSCSSSPSASPTVWRPTASGSPFMAVGGYATPSLWLSDGWDAARAGGWRAPLYWEPHADGWRAFGLHGLHPVDPHAPVRHVSFYEADAYAPLAGPAPAPPRRSGSTPPAPRALDAADDVAWQWTASAYQPLPPASSRPPARWASTTASSWSTRWCCAAAPPPPRLATRPRPTATSSARRSAGSSPACAWPPTRARRATPAPSATTCWRGLSRPHKAVPPKWLYDERGSALFEAITALPEYYPTRTETARCCARQPTRWRR